MITYFIERNRKSKKILKSYNVLYAISKTVDTFDISATSAPLKSLSVLGFGLIVLQVSCGAAGESTLG